MENGVESMRTEHESPTEWNLRKHFLEAHWGKFSQNRLQCLSACFVNVELYGCAYPDQLMIELKDLIEDISDVVDDHRTTLKENTQIKFVKAKESDNVGASNPPRKMQGMTFVKATNDFSSMETNESQSLQEQVEGIHVTDRVIPSVQPDGSQFYLLGAQIRETSPRFRDPVAHLNTAVQLASMSVSLEFNVRHSGRHFCQVSINNVFIASAEGMTKHAAQRSACENAVVSLRKPYMQVLTLGPTLHELHTSDFPIEKEDGSGSRDIVSATSLPPGLTAPVDHGASKRGARKRKLQPGHRPLEQFIILEPLRANYVVNAASILHESGAFNKMPVNFDFQMVGEGTRCDLWIGGTLAASEVGADGKSSAKTRVAAEALTLLRDTNWTLFVKQQVDGSDAGITKDEVSLGAASNEAIPASNVGSKLLKLMGWAGGGVGKDGTGIAEPVSMEATVNRQGLGLSEVSGGFTKNFFPKIKRLLEEYITSNNTSDLSFAPDFTKEERATIHKHCQKLGLKTRSYNKGGDRFLVVSRKRDCRELIRHIVSEGGETSKYRLVPPGEYEDAREEVLAELVAMRESVSGKH